MKVISYILLSCIISSCIRIPSVSVDLVDEIDKEVLRMHKINLELVNDLIENKKTLVRNFIQYEYGPDVTTRSMNALRAAGLLVVDSIPSIVNSLSEEINKREIYMINQLTITRDSTLYYLNTDYNDLKIAQAELKNLIESASAVEKQRKEVFEYIKAISDNKIDLNTIEKKVNDFIIKGGEEGGEIINLFESIKK